MATKKATNVRQKTKPKKNIAQGVVHIQSTFNNTIVCITDVKGGVISWSTAGHVGFKGSRKSTPFAASQAAEDAAKKAIEHGVRKVDVQVKGPGPGRETGARVELVPQRVPRPACREAFPPLPGREVLLLQLRRRG